MLQEIYETFSHLVKKYPTTKPYLTKCYTDIKAKSEDQDQNQDRKEKIKKLLQKFMNMKHLQMT